MKILFVLDFDTYKENYIEVAEKAQKYVDIIWFRVKNLEANKIYDLAGLLRKKLPNAFLSISERADIAELLNFNAVHLNSRSISPEIIKLKYPEIEIGYSAHFLDELNNVKADFYTLSPIYYTKKDYEVKPLGEIDLSNINKKVFALGGISKNNIENIKRCGFYGIAGISFFNDLNLIYKIIKK
jgi:thiamine-phosphate pyrophosphorylase